MLRRPLGWLLRPGLGRRIAATMLISLFAVQAQALLQVIFLSDPQVRLVGTRWLSETVETAARASAGRSEKEKAEAVASALPGVPVSFEWLQKRPDGEASEESQLVFGRLKATIQALLGGTARDVVVTATRLRYHVPFETMRISVDPATLADVPRAEPLAASEPESLIPATLQVAVLMRDGTWLVARPVSFDAGAVRSLPWAPLSIAGLIIAAASALLARRIIAPLERLVHAANRIGTTRELVRVPDDGLHEFAAVAHAFEDMQRRLLRFVEDRTQMLAAISHDLRSSLTRMRLVTEASSGDPELDALAKEIDEMEAMIDATLAFASDQAKTVSARPLDLAALLISIADQASDAGHDCRYDGPDHQELAGDPVSLKRAFRNLVENALKYGHRARLALHSDASTLQVTVDDDGPGIPEQDREAAFAPFRRLDPARSHALPGAGLGLTIARDIIHAHGGSIALENRESGGLRVVVVLSR